MDNRKLFGIFIIVLSFLLMLLIIYFIWFYQWGAVQPEEEPAVTTPIEQALPTPLPSEPSISLPPPTAPVERRELTRDDLAKMAGSFAERFGSYSNHSNYGNISDLKIFMSRKMQAWADKFIEDSRGEYSDIYYGITTKSVTQEVRSFDSTAGSAKILVKTQRRESIGAQGNETVFYQDVIIDFVKENGAWKVDSALWQTR